MTRLNCVLFSSNQSHTGKVMRTSHVSFHVFVFICMFFVCFVCLFIQKQVGLVSPIGRSCVIVLTPPQTRLKSWAGNECVLWAVYFAELNS